MIKFAFSSLLFFIFFFTNAAVKEEEKAFSFYCTKNISGAAILGFCNHGNFYGPLNIGNFFFSETSDSFIGIGQFGLIENHIKGNSFALFQLGGYQTSGSGNLNLFNIAVNFSNRKDKTKLFEKNISFPTSFSLIQAGIVNMTGKSSGFLQTGIVNVNYHNSSLIQIAPVNINLHSISFFQVALFNISGDTFSVVSLSVFQNMNYRFNGVLRSGFYNHGSEIFSLFELGAININHEWKGFLQTGLLMNINDHTSGVHISPYNSAIKSSGLQIGGFNTAETLNGVQIGIINHAKILNGIQIGIINFAKNGFLPLFPIINASF